MDFQKMIEETFPLYEDMDDMEVAQTIWRRRGAEILGERLKDEFLKNATDIRINRDFLADIKQYIHEKYLDYKVGDKIKLVLIKEEL